MTNLRKKGMEGGRKEKGKGGKKGRDGGVLQWSVH
jgi:hypothetical protein